MSKRLTETLLQNRVQICNSYDIVGDIAIIRLTEESRKYSNKIGTAIMTTNRHVRTVLAQTSAVNGEFRLGKLRHMFAGVGCFSILIARNVKVEKVYSIDVNPLAIRYMRENVRMNGVYGTVVPIPGDAGQIIEEKLRGVADRVLMPLPEKALEYLPYGLLSLKKTGEWIHFYDFEQAEKGKDVVEKVKTKVRVRLQSLDVAFEVPYGRKVRATGPNWHQVVLDIKVKPTRSQ